MEKITDEIQQRLDRELGSDRREGICKLLSDCPGIFVILPAKTIPCRARGSAVGTVVGIVLGSVTSTPSNMNLLLSGLWTRSVMKCRMSDIDILPDRRPKTLSTFAGNMEEIAQIITFGTMKACGHPRCLPSDGLCR